MSLLEDVFLEDEADEAQDLERIIEGDDEIEDIRKSSDVDSLSGEEAEEDKRRVDPTQAKPQRVTKNPRFLLNPARLTGPRGIQVIPDHFKDFKFKGKGHEKEDLDHVLKKLEYWAYRLYPKFKFEDCLKKIEVIGRKRPVMVHLHKIRTDQLLPDETVVQKDSSDDEAPQIDEFDVLLQQQINLARSTPGPHATMADSEFGKSLESQSINDDQRIFASSQPLSLPSTMPKVASSPSISDEQRERIMRNRKLAEERRLARLSSFNNTASVPTDIIVPK